LEGRESMGSIDTREDIKKLLKQLFLEKKRVRELEKKLDNGDIEQKFQAKLLQQHQSESTIVLKQQLVEREQQLHQVSQQFHKTKLALKQLFEQLQEAKEKIKTQENLPPQVDAQILEEKEKFYKEAVQELEKDKEGLEEEVKGLHQEREKTKEHHEREIQRFESERSRLVEKLAESLSQHQRQQDIVKDLHEEINRLRQSNGELKQHLEKAQANLESLIEQKQQDTDQIRALKQQQLQWMQEEEKMRSRLLFLEARLSESDVAAVHEEYTEKLRLQKEEMQKQCKAIEGEKDLILKQLEEQEKAKEKLLESSYEQIRELSKKATLTAQEQTKYEELCKNLQEQVLILQREQATIQTTLRQAEQAYLEKQQEIRQAQQHLAKKVKETTLLRDLTEEQKEKITHLEEELSKHGSELQQLKHGMQLHKMHEEKLQLVVEEWQDKFREQAQELQQNKQQVGQLQKIKEERDEMAATLSELKKFLGK